MDSSNQVPNDLTATTGTTSNNSDQLVMSVKCYVKLLLHCMKYPHATVNGVILAGDGSTKSTPGSGGTSGKDNSKGGKKQKSTGQVKSTSQSPPQANTSGGGTSGEGNRMELVDVVPLFHLGHGLTPMTELALLQVSVIFFVLSHSPPMSYDPTTTTLGHTFKPINLRKTDLKTCPLK